MVFILFNHKSFSISPFQFSCISNCSFSHDLNKSNCTKFSLFTTKKVYSIYSGTYESGIASYKHLYFNTTSNTLKIWILTVVAIIALYEVAKHLITLIIAKSIRYSMMFLFCLSIFSHYYAWWAYVNYYNDDFYSQWNHQMFFTVSFRLAAILSLIILLADEA